MRRPWTPDERSRVIENYARVGAVGLTVHLGRSADSISSQARRHGVVARGHRKAQANSRAESSESVNARFFDTATPAAAFVAGYFWACGSVKSKHRQVLRCATRRGDTAGMQIVQNLMESRHLIQTYEYRHVVEICNSRLVTAFIDRWGIPPGRKSDGAPPRLENRLLSQFAAGYLLGGGGSRNDCHVRWCGHPSVMVWLAEKISSQAKVPPPEYAAARARHMIRWSDIPAVGAISAWLDRGE